MATAKQLAARAKFKTMLANKRGGSSTTAKFPPGSAQAVAVGQPVNPTPIAQAQNVMPVKVKPRKPTIKARAKMFHATRGKKGF